VPLLSKFVMWNNSLWKNSLESHVGPKSFNLFAKSQHFPMGNFILPSRRVNPYVFTLLAVSSSVSFLLIRCDHLHKI